MKPSKIKRGQKLLIKAALGTESLTAFFVKRIPAQCGRKAINLVRFPEYEGLMSPEDDGTCEMSDYDLSRRGEFAR